MVLVGYRLMVSPSDADFDYEEFYDTVESVVIPAYRHLKTQGTTYEEALAITDRILLDVGQYELVLDDSIDHNNGIVRDVVKANLALSNQTISQADMVSGLYEYDYGHVLHAPFINAWPNRELETLVSIVYEEFSTPYPMFPTHNETMPVSNTYTVGVHDENDLVMGARNLKSIGILNDSIIFLFTKWINTVYPLGDRPTVRSITTTMIK